MDKNKFFLKSFIIINIEKIKIKNTKPQKSKFVDKPAKIDNFNFDVFKLSYLPKNPSFTKSFLVALLDFFFVKYFN